MSAAEHREQPLPVVDIGPFRRGDDPDAAAAVAAALLDACHRIGFVYVTGHGIDASLERQLFEAADDFFALPLEDKQALAIANSPAFRGYTTLGDERTNGASDWREQIDLGPEEAAPPADTVPAWKRLRGPNQWPSAVPQLRPAVLEWMSQLEALGLDALRALAVGLGLDREHFDPAFMPDSDLHVKIIHYPSQPADADRDQGVGAHSDTGLATFILQDTTGGLQVEIDGEFVDAPPVEGAYLMNLGEMLQRATDGYLLATRHRVLSPPGGADRISMALFLNPSFDRVFQTVPLRPEMAAVAATRPSTPDEVRALFGENNLKTRLRSHPDVAERHYADVLASDG